MELPNYLDYEKIQSMDPYAQVLAGRQMDLARTFQQEKLAQEQERAKQMNLANVFAEQVNPLKVEEQRQQNLERQYGMPAKRVAGEIAEETAPQTKQAAMQKAILGLKQSDLDMMDLKAREMARSSNPEEAKQGLALMQLTPEFVKLRTQHANEMEKVREQRASAERIAGMQIGGQRQLEQMRIDAGKYAKSQQAKDFAGGVAASLAKAKKAHEQYAILNRAAVMAQQGGELELARQYQEQASALEPQARAELQSAGTLQRRLEGGEIVSTPRGESVPSIAPPGAAPQAKPLTQYQAGQTYTGKTGTYKYLGGDPKDKGSWEKVK